MPAIPKIAGCASIISSLYDIHKTAMIYSQNEYRKVMGDTYVSNSIACQKNDYVSYKDTQRKNWSAEHNYTAGISEAFAAVKGYLKGFMSGAVRYMPKLVLSAMAIVPKTKCKALAYLSTIALAGVELWDYLKNGTGMFEKSDYLKR